jgi:RNA polymerase sigma factor (sigma-70 family)
LENERVLTFVFSLFVLFQKFLLQQKQVEPDPLRNLLRTRRDCDGLHFYYTINLSVMQPLSNNELLRGFNRGEEKARNAVYYHYHDALLTMIRRMTNNSSSAEDLVNDAFEVFYKESRSFENLSDLRDFLFQTSRNLCINHFKKQASDQRKHEGLEARRAYADEDFYADIHYSETRDLLFKSVESLPDKLKTVFRLRYFEDLSNESIAEQLGVEVKTVYNRYFDARRMLKWDLERIQRFTLYLLNLFL